MTDFDGRDREPFPAGLVAIVRRRGRILLWSAVAALVIAAFLLGRGSRRHDEAEVHDHDHEEEAGEERWYTCSMHPQVRTMDPREKCPICGMDLIPVPAGGRDDGDPSEPRLTVSPRSAALMRVETAPVERRPVSTSLHLYGKLDVDETRLRHISAWVPGRLEKLFVNTTGELVRAGAPMVLIYSPSLVAAQQELLQSLEAVRRLPADAAPSHRAGAESLAAAARDKLRLLGLGEKQVAAIIRRGKVEDRLVLTAPVSGVVTAREATEGMYVSTGERIYSIADLTHLWVHLDVHEREVAWLEVEQPATFTVRALPGEPFQGTVVFIDPRVDEAARTVRVRVDLPNPEGRLKPGMFVTGEIESPYSDDSPLVIPASAPLITGRRAVVYVQVPDTEAPTFEGRNVVLGPRAGNVYVVREGLEEGELVVVRGNFKIDSELQIRGRPSMMAPAVEEAPEVAAAGSPPAELDVPPDLGERVGSVVQANFALVEALSDDDPPAVGASAERIGAALAAVDETLVRGVARDQWIALSARMRAGLEALLEQHELDDMRPHFEVFSDALTEAVRRFGAGSQAPIHRAVCPMVQGRSAYWLQADRSITNPYHGARMYSCGSIAETLVAEMDSGNEEDRR